MLTQNELDVINHYKLSVAELEQCKNYIGELRIAMPYIDTLEEIPKYKDIMYTLMDPMVRLYEIDQVLDQLTELHNKLFPQ